MLKLNYLHIALEVCEKKFSFFLKIHFWATTWQNNYTVKLPNLNASKEIVKKRQVSN